MKIGLYRGASAVSRLIRWQTRSIYSHAAFVLYDGSVIEAWHHGGVQRRANINEGHQRGTRIDLFAIDGGLDQRKALWFLNAQIGKKYDFRSVFRFMSRVPAAVNDKWFCSELVAAACIAGGAELLARIESQHVSPRDLSLSTRLIYTGHAITE